MKMVVILLSAIAVTSAQWPSPKAPAVSGADGYVDIPNAVLAPTKNGTYRVVFDATRAAQKPTDCCLRSIWRGRN
jgi:hypothetical protein